MPGVSRGVGDRSVLTGDGVIELHAGTKSRIQGSFDNEHLVVTRRGEIFAVDLGDRQHEPPGLDLPIGKPQMPEQFGAADLEPAQIIGVVDDAHGVGVTVNDPVGGSVGQGVGLRNHRGAGLIGLIGFIGWFETLCNLETARLFRKQFIDVPAVADVVNFDNPVGLLQFIDDAKPPGPKRTIT